MVIMRRGCRGGEVTRAAGGTMSNARKSVVIVVSLLLSAAAFVGVVSAHYYTGIYIYEGGAQKDPMNLTFYSNATLSGAVDHVVHHEVTWTDDRGGPAQFWDHDAFRDAQAQRGECVECNRPHIRFLQGADADSTWGTYTVAAAHYENVVYFVGGCGAFNHVVIDFDGQRDQVQRIMHNSDPGDHPDWDLYAYNNNTAPSPQCDGSMPQSNDGLTAWQNIP